MSTRMVLVQRTTATPLPNMEPDESEFYDSENDLNAMATAIARMNEREHSYILKQTNGRSSPTKGDFTPRSIGTPRTPRSQFLSTPKTHRSQTFVGSNATVLNDSVPFTQRNSAISNGYASPRQFTLSACHFNRDGSGLPVRLQNIHGRQRQMSFDYDENEEIILEDVKYYRRPKVPVKRTETLYLKACAICGIVPSQNYAKQTTTSRIVQMSNCSLSHLTIKPIAISLVKDRRIHTLDISGNEIGPMGVMYIAEMLLANNSLFEINLSGTYPGEEGLKVLAEVLPKNKFLRILRLESNNIDHTEAYLLVDIIANTPNLTELYLGHNNLGYEGGKLLAKALETNHTLHTLDLRWNHFRKESGKQLCTSISLNEGLQKLNVSWNGLGKEGCIALAKSLPKNHTLVDLDLTCNRIDVVGLPFLLHGLVRNSSLQRVNLGKNPLTTEGAKAIIKGITGAKAMKIRELNLEEVPVDREFIIFVERMKESRKIDVAHEEAMHGAVELAIRCPENATIKEHIPSKPSNGQENDKDTEDIAKHHRGIHRPNRQIKYELQQSHRLFGKMKEHDPHDLNRFDPVMVLIEYIRIDNLRLIDLFQFFDTHNRGMLSRTDIRDGVATIGLPLTEYHLDCIMKDIDTKKDGYIDLEEFMNAQKEMGKIITQRTTKAKGKGKEDLGLKELRKILKELVEKRNTRNKEKAAKKLNSAWTGAVNKVKVMAAAEKSRKSIEEGEELPLVGGILQRKQSNTFVTGDILKRKQSNTFVTDTNKSSPTGDIENGLDAFRGPLPDVIDGEIYGLGDRQEFIENVDTKLAWNTPRKNDEQLT